MSDTRTFRVVDEDGDYYEVIGDPMDALNAAYRERAHLVALLAAVYPSHVGRTDPNTPDWAVVTLQLPTGQAAWHIAPDDEDLFQHVEQEPENAIQWDGHSTEEKYRRIDELTALLAEADEPDSDVMAVPRFEIEQLEWDERDGDVRAVDAMLVAYARDDADEIREAFDNLRNQFIGRIAELEVRDTQAALEARDAKAGEER